MTYVEQQEALFRALTPEELKTEVEAMRWLHKKGVSLWRISTLTTRQIKEGKNLEIIYHNKIFTFRRLIPLDGTPLEKQLNALPNLKSRLRIFPKKVWTKRKIHGFGVPTWSEDELRALLGLRPRPVRQKILEKKGNSYIITLKF